MTTSEFQPLVGIGQHNIALLFSHYLKTQQIPNHISEEQDNYVIYCDVAHLDKARVIFEQFIADPMNPKYQKAAWHSAQATEVNDDEPPLLDVLKSHFLAHAGIVTLSIFVICWAVYVLLNLGLDKSIFQFQDVASNATVLNQPWRILLPAFLHFSLLHIAFNTMWWWQIGGDIERVEGKWALLQLFLISAIVSNVGQYIVSGPYFGGLSGVVYAVVGYVWWAGWLAPQKGLQLSKPIVGFLLFWLLLGFANLLPVNVANTAHLLGLACGCAMAWLKYRV